MSQVLQMKRGTTVQNMTYTGQPGEVTVDTNMGAIRVHDGVTPGGCLHATADFLTSALEAINATMLQQFSELSPLGNQPREAISITTGVATPTQSTHVIHTEGEVAADDLEELDPISLAVGQWVMLRAVDGQAVTIKHQAAVTTPIILGDAADLVLSGSRWIILELTATGWAEVVRSYGGDLSAYRAWLGLGAAALAAIGTGAGEVAAGNHLHSVATVAVPGMVLKAASVNNVSASAVSVSAANIGAAPTTYDQAWGQGVETLGNEMKGDINQLVADHNALRGKISDLIIAITTAGLMAT